MSDINRKNKNSDSSRGHQGGEGQRPQNQGDHQIPADDVIPDKDRKRDDRGESGQF